MTQSFSVKIGNSLTSAETKKEYNEQVFTEIAPRYDFITRALSFWRDASWKKELLKALPNGQSFSCLDLACGTGDIAFLLARKYPDGYVTGIDITETMLSFARRRNTFDNIDFKKDDMGNLSAANSSMNIVTGGYALRNAPDLCVTLDEIHRVLKPRGYAAFLDFSKPENSFLQKIEYYVLKIWTGMWGLIFHGNHEVYSYIAESLNLYPNRKKLRKLFEEKNFTVMWSKLHFLGITESIIIQKNSQKF